MEYTIVRSFDRFFGTITNADISHWKKTDIVDMATNKQAHFNEIWQVLPHNTYGSLFIMITSTFSALVSKWILHSLIARELIKLNSHQLTNNSKPYKLIVFVEFMATANRVRSPVPYGGHRHSGKFARTLQLYTRVD